MFNPITTDLIEIKMCIVLERGIKLDFNENQTIFHDIHCWSFHFGIMMEYVCYTHV